MLQVKKLICDVFSPRKGENVLILNDFPSAKKEVNAEFLLRRTMARAWHHTFEELVRGSKFTVEPILTYEPTWGDSAPLPSHGVQENKKVDLQKKLKGLGKKDILLAITTFSATGPIDSLVKKQQFRFASMPGVTPDMSALEADYKIVAKKAKVLAKKLTAATSAMITFSTGHEVFFDLRNRNAFIDDGNCTMPGQAINLPSGEAYIALFDEKKSKTQGYIPVYYNKHLVVYEVKDNKIVDVVTDSPKSRQMLRYFSEDGARANIAELGLGCNDKATFINNVLQDEKIEGMHWAYGYNDYMGGTVRATDFKDPQSAVHVDVIYTKEAKIKIRQATLVYGEDKREVIIENSRYSFNVQQEFEKA